jgi:hypothetical protein
LSRRARTDLLLAPDPEGKSEREFVLIRARVTREPLLSAASSCLDRLRHSLYVDFELRKGTGHEVVGPPLG